MTDELPGRLLVVLRTATGNPQLDFAAPPEPLTGGFWAELLAFRLTGAPGGLDGDLVARVMPDPALARKETLVQAEVARSGFPTPKVRAAGGPGDGLGRAFMVMDRAPGSPLLAGLDGTRALAQLPRLAATIPEMLAVTMSELHRLDPGPLRSQMEAGLAFVPTVAGLLEHPRALSEARDRNDLAGAARWLAAHPPPAAPEVICHGDLHPFNLLAAPGGAATVLDWSSACARSWRWPAGAPASGPGEAVTRGWYLVPPSQRAFPGSPRSGCGHTDHEQEARRARRPEPAGCVPGA